MFKKIRLYRLILKYIKSVITFDQIMELSDQIARDRFNDDLRFGIIEIKGMRCAFTATFYVDGEMLLLDSPYSLRNKIIEMVKDEVDELRRKSFDKGIIRLNSELKG